MTRSARSLATLAAATLALSGLSCSDPVPPAALAAWTLGFVQSGGCTIKGHNAQLGYVTVNEVRDLKRDAEFGAEVYCTVTGSGFLPAKPSVTSCQLSMLSSPSIQQR